MVDAIPAVGPTTDRAHSMIDAHAHVISSEKARLLASGGGPSTSTIADLRAAQRAPMQVLLMESNRPYRGENQLLLDLALANPDLVAGVIGRWDFTADSEAQLDRIEAHAAAERWRGPRLALRDDVEDEWEPTSIARLTHQLAIRRRVIEVLAPWSRLEDAARIAEAAESVVVLDHLGLPPWDGQRDEWDRWERGFRRVAAHEHVITKISDLPLVQTPLALARADRAVELALSLFGDGRVMYASNWPWKPGPGEAEEEIAMAVGRRMTPAARDEFFGNAARRGYGLVSQPPHPQASDLDAEQPEASRTGKISTLEGR